MITVAVARFEDLLARGLRAVIESEPSLVIVASDFEHDRVDVILRAHKPHVAILDVEALTSLAQVRALSHDHPHTRLVLLADHPPTTTSVQLLAFGASACLGRDTQERDVLASIHLASRGLQLIPRAAAEHDAPHPGLPHLTAREAQVLPLLQQGQSNAEIARTLYVGVETVRSHASNIYRKLGVASRRDLIPSPSPGAPPVAVEPAGPHPERRRARPPGARRRPSSSSLHR